MVAQGRASAWGAAPRSCSPRAGGTRPRLVSPSPPPAAQEAATEGAERHRRCLSPPLPPQTHAGCRPKRLHAGAGQPGGAGAGPDAALSAIGFGVCRLRCSTWPRACPPCSQGGSRPERWGVEAPEPGLPAGPAPRFQELTGQLAGRERAGGWSRQSSVCPAGLGAPATACGLWGTLPAVRKRAPTCTCPHTARLPLPLLLVLPKRPGEAHDSVLWALAPVRRVRSLPHSPPGPRLALWAPEAKDPGRVSPDDTVRAARPPVALQGAAAGAHPERKADLSRLVVKKF